MNRPADIDDLVARARGHALGDLLHRTAARMPHKLALVNGDLRWTFAELDRAVNRTANALAARAVRRGDRVALVSHNCWQYVVASYALSRLGAILVPVNFMLTADEIAYILEHWAPPA